MQNAHEHQQLISRQSIWNPLAGWLTSGSFTMTDLRSVMPNSTTLVAGALLLAVLIRQTKLRTPELAIAAAIAVFLVTSPWVMPWYAFAAFPFLALRKPDLLTWTVALYSALILVGDQFPSLSPNAIGTIAHQTFETVVPVVACIACVIAIVRYKRDQEVSVAPVPATVLGNAALRPNEHAQHRVEFRLRLDPFRVGVRAFDDARARVQHRVASRRSRRTGATPRTHRRLRHRPNRTGPAYLPRPCGSSSVIASSASARGVPATAGVGCSAATRSITFVSRSSHDAVIVVARWTTSASGSELRARASTTS